MMNKFLITSDSSFFSELVIISHSRFEKLHLSFRSSKLSHLSCREAPSKSLQGFTLCFQVLFLFIILLSWWFVKDSFHSSIVLQDFSRSYDPSSLLQNKHGVQHMFCFEEFKHSPSRIPKCNSFYLIF